MSMLELLKNADITDMERFPTELEAIHDAIERSKRHLLSLPRDFDGEGSEAYTKGAVERAISFVKKLAISAWKVNHAIVPVPNILAGPDGSIDVCWKEDAFSLLINFPPSGEELASYHGHDNLGNTTEGCFDGSKLDQVFLFWFLDH